MSLAAVLQAARDKLQESFNVDANSCEVGFDGQPKPGCGQFYIAVHPVNWSGISGDWDLGEEYQVGVTLTMRMGTAPKDRWGMAVWLDHAADGSGLEARIRRAMTALHHNQEVRQAADALIEGGESGKILTPLQLLRIDNPIPRGPDWFSAPVLTEGSYAIAECGVSQQIVFGRCQRVQSIPDMD